MTFTYIPPGPIASAYIADRSRRSVLVGPYGGGKTLAGLTKLYLMALEQVPTDGVARSRYILSRLTRPQLTSTLVKSFHQLFKEKDGFPPFESAALRTTWRFRPATFSHDVEIEWQALALETDEDVARVLGLEATSILIDEARLVDVSLLGKLSGRLRYPAVSKHRSLELVSNPWDTSHPFHDLFVLNRGPDTALFHQPGGLDKDAAGNWIAENLQNLNQSAESILLPWNDPVRRELGVKYYEHMLADMSVDDARVNVHSKWGVSREGRPVYVDYDDSTHPKPLKYDPALPLELGTDFGLNSATVIYQQTMNGNVRVLAEFVTEGIGTVAHHERLKPFIAREFPGVRIGRATGDPAGAQRGADGEQVFTLVRRFFPTYQPARTNEIGTRIEAVNAMFRKIILGQPALAIDSKRCPTLRQGCVDRYMYKRVQGTGSQFKDEPEKNKWSHVCDALAYAVLGAGGGRPSVLAGHTTAGNREDSDFARACAARNSPDMRSSLFNNYGPERRSGGGANPRSWTQDL
jgi:hypothetical protein